MFCWSLPNILARYVEIWLINKIHTAYVKRKRERKEGEIEEKR